jgi:hypothetical protein
MPRGEAAGTNSNAASRNSKPVVVDDAAFFAVNSLTGDFFALTASFTTYLLRPISKGTMKATGKVVYAGNSDSSPRERVISRRVGRLPHHLTMT